MHQKYKLIAYQNKVIEKFIFKNLIPVLTEPDGTVMTLGDIKIQLFKAEFPRASAFQMPNRTCLICTKNISQVHHLLVIFKMQQWYIPRVTPILKPPYYYFTYDKKLAMKNKLLCTMSHSLIAEDINS